MKVSFMEARAIKERLLAQHNALRRLLADASAASAELVAGAPIEARLEQILTDLRKAFAEHNVEEEAAIEPLLAWDPAWGPARVARMREEHAAEHLLIRQLLEGPVAELAARIEDLAEEITAHMDAEERTFLHARSLRDTLS